MLHIIYNICSPILEGFSTRKKTIKDYRMTKGHDDRRTGALQTACKSHMHHDECYISKVFIKRMVFVCIRVFKSLVLNTTGCIKKLIS